MNFTEIIEQISHLQSNILVQRMTIILVYALLAFAANLFIDHILRRLANMSKMELDNKIIDAIHSPVYWTVFCLGVLHALTVQEIAAPWQTVIPNITQSFILISWSFAAFKILNLVFQKRAIELIFRKKISNDAFKIIKRLLRVVVVVLAFAGLLTLWNINLTPLFASAGIAGIAVAMAAKDSLANFFGGMSIFMDSTFKEGDYIVLDSGERGEVVDIGMRSSRIMTRDDVLITIPNSILANTKIINESAPIPRFRIRIPVGVAYGSDPKEVEKILLDIATTNDKLVQDPEPRVRFRQLGSSSLDFELLCWVEEPSLKGLVTHILLNEIYDALNRENISIPFPQMDVHLKETS